MRDDAVLFNGSNWFSLERHLNEQLAREVQSLPTDRILNTAPDAMTHFFVDKYLLELPVLQEDEISVEQREADIDISHSRMFDYGITHHMPRTVRGVEYEFHIPFTGDSGLFKTQPTSFTSSLPCAEVSDNILIHTVRGTSLSSKGVRKSVDELVRTINQYLGWLGGSTASWNARLPGMVNGLIDARRSKLIADQTNASGLGFKIRERPGASRTFVAPEVRRKIAPVMPPASAAPWRPEPVLEMAQYEHILKIIGDSALVMERSPAAFSTMGEEDIRTQMLFMLNGHFEGQATAETFNKEGKTDILIRSDGKNIFIGECKFWGGKKVLIETIDQLLGYASWRDTKVAVIMFNRNKDFSAVLAQIRAIAEEHPNFKRFVSKLSETQFRFIFTQKDDLSREMTLTIMVFDVP